MTKLNTTVAVTRNGRGDLWLFPSKREALRHPLVQYGDAVLSSPPDVARMYNRLHIRDLVSRLGENWAAGERILAAASDIDSVSEWNCFFEEHSGLILERMMSLASEPSVVASEVLTQIVFDRDHYNDGLKETEIMSDSNENENKETAVKNIAGFAPDSVITAGMAPAAETKEGEAAADPVAYGPDNNPKREGSKSHERFTLYKFGSTVAENVEAGVTPADVKYDAGKGFIVVTAAE